MPYKIRPGVELIQVCDQHILVATREVWSECARVRPIPKLWAGCWNIMKNDKTDRDVVRTFTDLLRRPEEELSQRLGVIFTALAKDGFLIEVPDEEGDHDED